MNEDGIVGGGWYLEGGMRLKEATLGKLATVWDGEVYGIRGVLEDTLSETNVLILSDSQGAIAAVKKAGCIGKARTRDLKFVMEGIRERQSRLGPNVVLFGWIKAHNELHSNEEAN